MKLGFTAEQEAFRKEAADWLEEKMSGDFADIRYERTIFGKIERRRDWERCLGAEGWSVIGYPKEYGGRDADIAQQVIFAEEYARSGAPGRSGHIGVELAGPTLLHFGTQEQKDKFIPDMVSGKTLWAQGYSEPGAGSDLSNVRTKARLEGDKWIIDGQKIWTSGAQFADWIFVLARTEPGSKGPKGLSFFLVPMHQDGITVRPIKQLTGESEFNETFFDGAETDAENIVGGEGNGWKVAMGLLAFERGVGTLGQLTAFQREFDAMIEMAKENGVDQDPLIRQRIGEAFTGLKVMRHSSLRMLSDESASLQPAAMTYKLYWSAWHKSFTELCLDVGGLPSFVMDQGEYDLKQMPYIYLTARADSIYGGTNQIQRNIVSEHALGMPREPRGKT